MANIILQEGLYDRECIRRWTTWEDFLRCEHPVVAGDLDGFLAIQKKTYAQYTPEFVEAESGIPAATIVGSRFTRSCSAPPSSLMGRSRRSRSPARWQWFSWRWYGPPSV